MTTTVIMTVITAGITTAIMAGMTKVGMQAGIAKSLEHVG